MSTATLNRKPRRPTLDAQIRRAQEVLRELKETLEDLEDRRALASAKKRNNGRAGTPWKQAAKELEI